ncbi:hypothetical protein MSAN_01946200 [Mycena sanguinolenta]|uniref:Ubiquitin-like domain-containing protein n=1 Tax=Mycena sanguinolenta TaxID=230812 RepID=A0A8H6XNF7_9AGAR|nr:hypothetical protein MSAN_01946200 [Mycena sanguinolenta]
MVKIYVTIADTYVADRISDVAVWAAYDVDLGDSVRKLKTDIHETEGIDMDWFCLRYEGIGLEDEEEIQSYALQEGCIVELHPWLGVARPALCLPPPAFDFVENHQKALHNWDGVMKHPHTKGLSLRKGTVIVARVDQSGWCFGHEDGQNTSGYFPLNYVGYMPPKSPIRLHNYQSSLFRGALPDPAIFVLRLGEMGQSYVQVTLRYENCAPPGEPTPIEVALVCAATGGRRITSLGIMIRTPNQSVRDLKYPIPRPHQSISVKATDDRSVENTLGVALNIPHAGLTANASTSREHEQTVTESGFRESQLKISGNEHGEHSDIAHWRVDAAEGVGGRREGIPAQMKFSFVLDEKPAVFRYRFFVVSTDAKGNSKTRSGGSLEMETQEGEWKMLEWWARLVTSRKRAAP